MLGRSLLTGFLFGGKDTMATWPEEWEAELKQLKNAGLTYKQIAAEMTKTFATPFRKNGIKAKARRMGITAHIAKAQSERKVSVNSDGTESVTALMRLKHEPNKDARTLLTLCGYDPDQFDMISGDYKVYEQHSTEDGTVPQYSIHIRVKPKLGISGKELASLLNEEIKPVTITSQKLGEHNLVVPLFDLHFGIATFARYQDTLSQILAIISHGYKHIVIELGGDLLHSDYMDKTQTVKGTQLDHADMVKAWSDAKQFVGSIIETSLACSQHVSLRAIGGNHDFDMQWAFADGLADRYPQLSVHNTINYRQAYRIGHVGILMAHGDVALKKLPMLFATEHSDIWATSTWREIHYGHFHHETVNDDTGVIMRQMGTPKPADGYEKKNGYTMASKTMQVFDYDDNRLRTTYDVG